jgi:23S rRNA (pseudouridine1915-N3)-methyltransferase
MYKITSIGKIKNNSLKTEINTLSKRINRLEILELKEYKNKDINLIKEKEFNEIQTSLDNDNYNVLLWEEGENLNTKQLYEKIKKIDKKINFIITGPFGPSEKLKSKVNLILSLSPMTFTHEQALYLLLEQLYRIECIKKNIPYTK